MSALVWFGLIGKKRREEGEKGKGEGEKEKERKRRRKYIRPFISISSVQVVSCSLLRIEVDNCRFFFI